MDAQYTPRIRIAPKSAVLRGIPCDTPTESLYLQVAPVRALRTDYADLSLFTTRRDRAFIPSQRGGAGFYAFKAEEQKSAYEKRKVFSKAVRLFAEPRSKFPPEAGTRATTLPKRDGGRLFAFYSN